MQSALQDPQTKKEKMIESRKLNLVMHYIYSILRIMIYFLLITAFSMVLAEKAAGVFILFICSSVASTIASTIKILRLNEPELIINNKNYLEAGRAFDKMRRGIELFNFGLSVVILVLNLVMQAEFLKIMNWLYLTMGVIGWTMASATLLDKVRNMPQKVEKEEVDEVKSIGDKFKALRDDPLTFLVIGFVMSSFFLAVSLFHIIAGANFISSVIRISLLGVGCLLAICKFNPPNISSVPNPNPEPTPPVPGKEVADCAIVKGGELDIPAEILS